MNKPNILITNDDGIYSEGIYALWEAMGEVGNPFVVAPNTEQSGSGHGITLNKPLRVNKITRLNGFKGYAVTGSPADCTKIGIRSLMKSNPDILISGINQGANLGTNLIYSGTVSAATEGAVLGIPSIAISLASFKTSSFDLAKTVAIDTVKHVLRYSLPKGTLLNVNVPCCDKDQINGTRITKQGNQYFVDEYEKRTDPSHKDYYWIKGEIIDDDSSIDYDGKAISENYISITPIHFKLTNEQYLKELKAHFADE